MLFSTMAQAISSRVAEGVSFGGCVSMVCNFVWEVTVGSMSERLRSIPWYLLCSVIMMASVLSNRLMACEKLSFESFFITSFFRMSCAETIMNHVPSG